MEPVPPDYDLDAFDCPSCGAYAHQEKRGVYGRSKTQRGVGYFHRRDFDLTECARCHKSAVWVARDFHKIGDVPFHSGWVLVDPARPRVGRPPHEDMPEAVKAVYEEAREVGAVSDRAAVALCRLALQHLVDDLVPGKGRLDDKIGRLVERGLRQQIQRAMDVLRVTGNDAVHPGQITEPPGGADDAETAPAGPQASADTMLRLLNEVVEQVIAAPARTDALWEGLPAAKREAVDRRDGRTES